MIEGRLRIDIALQPINTALFSNSPFPERRRTEWLLAQYM
jgi:gamma-glutamylcysteine synthetase